MQSISSEDFKSTSNKNNHQTSFSNNNNNNLSNSFNIATIKEEPVKENLEKKKTC